MFNTESITPALKKKHHYKKNMVLFFFGGEGDNAEKQLLDAVSNSSKSQKLNFNHYLDRQHYLFCFCGPFYTSITAGKIA